METQRGVPKWWSQRETLAFCEKNEKDGETVGFQPVSTAQQGISTALCVMITRKVRNKHCISSISSSKG